MKKLNQNILIETIDLSAGTQQRPLSPDVVQHYIDLRKDGIELPPVELICTGEVYLLWDGFHRTAVAQTLGETHIRANVEKGNLRRALFLSYAANSQHGLPRQPGATQFVVDKMLQDSEWSKLSMANIGRHVGCSRQFVFKRKSELSCQPVDKSKEPTKSPKGAPTRTETEPTHPLTDDEGQQISPPLTDRFLSRSVIKERINELDQVKNSVKNRIADGDLTYALLNQQGFKTDMQNLRNRLKAAIPHALCPYCEGGCGACHEMGFVNKETWKAAPKNES